MRMLNKVLVLLGMVMSTANAGGQGTPPQITSFEIAKGSFNTAERIVRLDIRVAGTTPTAYRVSERADFVGAGWKAFTTSPNYTLSSTPGLKTVYVQVGSGRAVTVSNTKTTTFTLTTTIGDYVLPPAVLSAVASGTITLGLPDLSATVEMPAQVQDGVQRMFDLTVNVWNKGQATPPGQVIHLYNSFVLNQLAIESYDVTFGLSRLVGDGCKITDIPTIECSLAPIPPNGGVQVKLRGSVTRLLSAGQTESSPTLRTRIYGVAESNTANNWVDTPLKVVK